MTSEASRRPRRVRMRRSRWPGRLDQAVGGELPGDGTERRGHRDAAPGANRQEQRLLDPRFGIEHLVAGFDRRPGPDRGDVALRGAEVPPPAAVEVPVRGRADREVVTLVPVEEVVPALATGSGPVRDLVPLVPGAAQDVVGDLVLLGLVVVVGRPAPAARDVLAERCARFDGQRVRAHVVGLEPEDTIEAAAPVVDRLARRAVDQIQVEVLEAGGAGRPDRASNRSRVVGAAKLGEHVRRSDCTPSDRRFTPAAA